MESVGYCLRVQALEGYGDKLAAMALSNDYVGLLVMKHEGKTGENPHYHAVVRTGVNPQAFRVRMKKLFPDGKGNQHMSIVPWDGNDKALSYLFHEDPQATLIARKGLTDERIVELRAQNEAVQILITKAKSKASWTLENDAYEHFKDYSKQRIIETGDTQIAAYIYLTALRSEKYPPQAWHIKAMVIKVRFRLLGGDMIAEQDYAAQLASNLYRV